MVLAETLKHYFQTLGVNIEDQAFLDKCLDLCDLYNVGGEVLVDTWVAFMVEKNVDMEPTLESLERMEHSVLKKDSKNVLDALTTRGKSLTSSNMGPQTLRNDVDNEDILEIYGYKGPATPNVKRVRSPDGTDGSVLQQNDVQGLETNYSPAGYTRKIVAPRRIRDIQTRGKILEKFGGHVANWRTTNQSEVHVGKTNAPHVPAQAMYMFELLSKKATNMQRVCREYGARLCSTWCKISGKDAPPITSNVNNQSQTSFRTWGRIMSLIDGQLDASTVMLEGCQRSVSAVPLDLTNIQRYSIFPGQILGIEGTNPNGDTLVAQNIFVSGYTRPPQTPKFKENLQLVIASGPFTDLENLDYQPLLHLMDHVVDTVPHVLILVGPFVPCSHPDVENATILDTFQELFEQIVKKIMKYVKGKCTQVVLIPSFRDAHHDPIYPTPEFFLPKSMHSPNLHLMPDPCMLDIEGLTVGATSTDIMRHLGGEEWNRNMIGMDRVGRLANHILSQGCFYPLYPPSKEVNVDTALWEKYASMYEQPHILVLPSDMKHFCKWTHDCLAINPERLNKYSYARIIVRPSLDDSWTRDQIDCEILKI